MKNIFISLGLTAVLSCQMTGSSLAAGRPEAFDKNHAGMPDAGVIVLEKSTEDEFRIDQDLHPAGGDAQEPRVVTEVLVIIAGVVAGYLRDGVIYYYSGYSGYELCTAGLNYLNSLCYSNRNINGVKFSSASSTVASSYTTNDGNECVRVSGGHYACKFSVRETE